MKAAVHIIHPPIGRYITPGLEFFDTDHAYFYKGRHVPSVTQCLRKDSDAYYKHAPAQAMENARRLGTAVDNMIAEDLDRTLVPGKLDAKLLPYFAAWRAFVACTRFRAIAWKSRLYSKYHDYAGELDVLGQMMLPSPRIVLLDTKRVHSIAPYTALQLAGYDALVREQGGALPIPDVRAALWLGGGDRFAWIPYTGLDHTYDFDRFIARRFRYAD